MASELMIFQKIFANLAFRLPWQPIKFTSLDKIDRVSRGLLQEHRNSVKLLSKYLRKIAMNDKFFSFSFFPLLVNGVAIAIKANEQ